ncbi:monogalactosyldiacylglycerol synthase [Desulfocucumis palustris]|uniref:Monogalactosyldiacylglycerol synthase n=1 Tax=Desulfocucumis palustris TaxID=1898651 RepID=A0A2L2X9F7_9FIRM|nr:glycosyltransferase [Desulfocucumis palustris]GBF32670.1 monogalactosyldiacylglycerol synthase [Desulfocucumis palustris]
MMAMLERVVILSVTAGTGHMQAAEAIKSAILEKNPRAEVTVLDTFRYTSPFLEKVVLGTYMEMIKITPVVYGYLYRRAEKGQPLSGFAKNEFTRIMNRFSAAKLIDFLEVKKPQAVICTHPFPLGILATQRRQKRFSPLIAGVLTDYTVHSYWVFPEVDCYLAAAPELVGEFGYYHIPPEKVYPTGIPIELKFSVRLDKTGIRKKLGLSPGLPTILVMGGGLGMGSVAETVKALGTGTDSCQLLVVAGKNQQLRWKIERLAGDLVNPVKVFGYVDNVNELMTASDLMVGKAGGLTCAEAMAKGLPMFIYDPLPGQEERNAEFLVAAGAAVKISRDGDLVKQVTDSIKYPARLEGMSRSALTLAKPDAAREAAGLITEMYAEPAGRIKCF